MNVCQLCFAVKEPAVSACSANDPWINKGLNIDIAIVAVEKCQHLS